MCITRTLLISALLSSASAKDSIPTLPTRIESDPITHQKYLCVDTKPGYQYSLKNSPDLKNWTLTATIMGLGQTVRFPIIPPSAEKEPPIPYGFRSLSFGAVTLENGMIQLGWAQEAEGVCNVVLDLSIPKRTEGILLTAVDSPPPDPLAKDATFLSISLRHTPVVAPYRSHVHDAMRYPGQAKLPPLEEQALLRALALWNELTTKSKNTPTNTLPWSAEYINLVPMRPMAK